MQSNADGRDATPREFIAALLALRDELRATRKEISDLRSELRATIESMMKNAGWAGLVKTLLGKSYR